MKIARVYFDETIPIDLQMRSASFETELGWEISEEQPGRVRLVRGDTTLTVQDYGYTLHWEPEPQTEEGAPRRGRRRP